MSINNLLKTLEGATRNLAHSSKNRLIFAVVRFGLDLGCDYVHAHCSCYSCCSLNSFVHASNALEGSRDVGSLRLALVGTGMVSARNKIWIGPVEGGT